MTTDAPGTRIKASFLLLANSLAKKLDVPAPQAELESLVQLGAPFDGIEECPAFADLLSETLAAGNQKLAKLLLRVWWNEVPYPYEVSIIARNTLHISFHKLFERGGINALNLAVECEILPTEGFDEDQLAELVGRANLSEDFLQSIEGLADQCGEFGMSEMIVSLRHASMVRPWRDAVTSDNCLVSLKNYLERKSIDWSELDSDPETELADLAADRGWDDNTAKRKHVEIEIAGRLALLDNELSNEPDLNRVKRKISDLWHCTLSCLRTISRDGGDSSTRWTWYDQLALPAAQNLLRSSKITAWILTGPHRAEVLFPISSAADRLVQKIEVIGQLEAIFHEATQPVDFLILAQTKKLAQHRRLAAAALPDSCRILAGNEVWSHLGSRGYSAPEAWNLDSSGFEVLLTDGARKNLAELNLSDSFVECGLARQTLT